MPESPEAISWETNQTAATVVDAALRVHSTLGPGLLESVYEICLAHELQKRGVQVARQVPCPVLYDSVQLDAGFRLDLLVENRVIVEVKCVAGLVNIHRAQVLTYLKLTGHRLGLLMNFNEALLRDGIKRVVL